MYLCNIFSKNISHIFKLCLISLEVFSKPKQKLHFHDQKGSFCDPNLQSVTILHKKLNIFIFFLSNFSSSFFQNIFHCNIPFSHDFPTIPNLLNSFNDQKVIMVLKTSATNKKPYVITSFLCDLQLWLKIAHCI